MRGLREIQNIGLEIRDTAPRLPSKLDSRDGVFSLAKFSQVEGRVIPKSLRMSDFEYATYRTRRLPRVGSQFSSRPEASYAPQPLDGLARMESEIKEKEDISNSDDELACDVVITQLYEDHQGTPRSSSYSEPDIRRNSLPIFSRQQTQNLKRTISSNSVPPLGEYRLTKRNSTGGYETRSLEDLLETDDEHFRASQKTRTIQRGSISSRNKAARGDANVSYAQNRKERAKKDSDKDSNNNDSASKNRNVEISAHDRETVGNTKIRHQNSENSSSRIQGGQNASKGSDRDSRGVRHDSRDAQKCLASNNNPSKITGDNGLSPAHQGPSENTQSGYEAGFDAAGLDDSDMWDGFDYGPAAVRLADKGGSTRIEKVLTVDPWTFEKCVKWIDGLPKKFSAMNCISVVQE